MPKQVIPIYYRWWDIKLHFKSNFYHIHHPFCVKRRGICPVRHTRFSLLFFPIIMFLIIKMNWMVQYIGNLHSKVKNWCQLWTFLAGIKLREGDFVDFVPSVTLLGLMYWASLYIDFKYLSLIHISEPTRPY